MRELTASECQFVGGGTGGVKATAPIAMNQVSPTMWKFSEGTATHGYIVTVVCSAGLSVGAQVFLNGSGKAFVAGLGISTSLPTNCTTTTINKDTGVQRICDQNLNCKTMDKNGKVIVSEVDPVRGDTGFEQMQSNYDAYEEGDELLAGGACPIYDSGTEPGGYQPAFTGGHVLVSAN